MNILWNITEGDVENVKKFVTQNETPFTLQRRKRNIERRDVVVDKNAIIKTLLMCLVTSQQRSGPNSPVGLFLRLNPFPIKIGDIEDRQDIIIFTKTILQKNGLNRFIDKIPRFFLDSITKIQDDNWRLIYLLENELNGQQTKETERKIADYIDDWLLGFGPKQSRNFLQALGLTKYEIPIDSRITDWLNVFGFPVTLTSTPLQDKGYYHFVSDGIQNLCDKANIYPCILDAAIFSSYDNGEWTDENTM